MYIKILMNIFLFFEKFLKNIKYLVFKNNNINIEEKKEMIRILVI